MIDFLLEKFFGLLVIVSHHKGTKKHDGWLMVDLLVDGF